MNKTASSGLSVVKTVARAMARSVKSRFTRSILVAGLATGCAQDGKSTQEFESDGGIHDARVAPGDTAVPLMCPPRIVCTQTVLSEEQLPNAISVLDRVVPFRVVDYNGIEQEIQTRLYVDRTSRDPYTHGRHAIVDVTFYPGLPLCLDEVAGCENNPHNLAKNIGITVSFLGETLRIIDIIPLPNVDGRMNGIGAMRDIGDVKAITTRFNANLPIGEAVVLGGTFSLRLDSVANDVAEFSLLGANGIISTHTLGQYTYQEIPIPGCDSVAKIYIGRLYSQESLVTVSIVDKLFDFSPLNERTVNGVFDVSHFNPLTVNGFVTSGNVAFALATTPTPFLIEGAPGKFSGRLNTLYLYVPLYPVIPTVTCHNE